MRERSVLPRRSRSLPVPEPLLNLDNAAVSSPPCVVEESLIAASGLRPNAPTNAENSQG